MTNPEARERKKQARKQQREEWKAERARQREAGSFFDERIATAPIHQCLVPANLFEQGIGNLVFTRLLPDGRIILAIFLLDVFCLGAKNSFLSIVPKPEYER